MPAKTAFSKVFLIVALLLFMPVLSKSQCAPFISIQNINLSLDYYNEDMPDEIDDIDVELGNGSMDGNYQVHIPGSSWQTVGHNFTGIELTGTITINYPDASSDVCEYINGVYFNPLPVELSVFEGRLTGDDVLLRWATESETDNSGFEVERSFDGNKFESVAFFHGAGDSAEKIWYSYEDRNVKYQAGGATAYYRLKQINFDQTFWYSPVIAVDLELKAKGFEVSKIMGWNLPERRISVYCHLPDGFRKLNYSVSTINGRLVVQNSVYPPAGYDVLEIDLSDEPENFFFITLVAGTETITKKLILHRFD